MNVDSISELSTSNGIIINHDLHMKNGSNNVTVGTKTLSTDVNFILPDSNGNINELLQTNGSGDLSYANISGVRSIYVATNGSDSTGNGSINKPYLTIKNAITQITGASILAPYTVLVEPGFYVEDNPIAMKSYVNLISVGNMTTTIISATNSGSNIIQGITNSGIVGFTLTGATTASAYELDTAGNSTFMNLTIHNCQVGISCDHASGSILGIGVSASGTITDFIYCLQGSLYVSNMLITSAAVITSMCKSSGSSSKLIASTIISEAGSVTNGLYATNGGELICLNSAIENSTNAIRIDNTGSNSHIKIHNFHIESSLTYDILCESATGIIDSFGADISRDKISTVNNNSIRIVGHDHETNATVDIFRSTIDIAIGQKSQGNNSMFGTGGAYVFNMSIKTWNGSAFADITYGNNISFPNTSVDTAIYIGDTDEAKFFGIGYLMGSTAMVLGGSGSIVFEYYDGYTKSWIEFNIMTTLERASTIQDGPFTGENDTRYTIRFDQLINSGISENNRGAGGWEANDVDSVTAYWIRIRIAVGITTSPVFKNTSLKGNYAEIRSNGTKSFHGQARSMQIVLSKYGELKGSAAAGTIDVSSNITCTGTEAGFDVSVEDEAYMRIFITEGMDLSSGLKIKARFHGETAGTNSSTQWSSFYLFNSHIKKNRYLDGTEPESQQVKLVRFIASDDKQRVKELVWDDRIDLSQYKPGDMIILMVRRPSSDDNQFINNITMSMLWAEYYQWQNGSLKEDVSSIILDEDFESGSFATNGWTTANETIAAWVCESGSAMDGTYSAYISDDTGSPYYNTYTNASSGVDISHLYIDLTFKDDLKTVDIYFWWLCNAEPGYDYGELWLVPTSTTPSAGSGFTENATHFKIGIDEYKSKTTTQYEKISLEDGILLAINNSTYRLVFSFRYDTGVVNNPTFTIDNVKVTQS